MLRLIFLMGCFLLLLLTFVQHDLRHVGENLCANPTHNLITPRLHFHLTKHVRLL